MSNSSPVANTIMAKLTDHVQWTRLITSSTDKNYSLDSVDDFRSGCRNVSHQQQFFSELPSSGWSHYTNYWYSWVQIMLEIHTYEDFTIFISFNLRTVYLHNLDTILNYQGKQSFWNTRAFLCHSQSTSPTFSLSSTWLICQLTWS